MRTSSLAAFLLLAALQGGAQTASAPSTKQTIEAEVVYVGPGGFFPSHITRKDGKFLLLLVDHSGLPDLNPAVKDPQGNTVSQMALGPSKRTHKASEVMNLGKGSFHLKEPSHAAWDLTIDIGQ
jgi:hypothetical protein